MEEKIINGHKQFVFSDNEKEEIRYLFVEQGYSQRQLMKKYKCSQKPMSRVLDELGLDHSRGNLTSFKYNYPYGIYDPNEEKRVIEEISKIESKKQKYQINDKYFDNLRNPEAIYTIGFLYADGCNHGCNSITLTLEEQDGYILEKINTNIGNENQVKFLDKSNKHDFGYNYKNQYQLSIYNYRIANVLNILGVTPRKSLVLQFPKWLHPSMYNYFILGVFDGDGSVYRFIRKKSTPQMNLTITSTEGFCKALVDICAKYIGIKGHIYDASCHNGVTMVFTLSGPLVVKKFMDWMYKDSTIFLSRKYKRYCEYFDIDNTITE